MKAIAYQVAGILERDDALVDVTLEDPSPSGHDILVSVEAVSVNPVDYKIRSQVSPEPGQWKVLGWDAVGTVVSTGEDSTKFRPGDRVWYAGSVGQFGQRLGQRDPDADRQVGAAPHLFTQPPTERFQLRGRDTGQIAETFID